MIRFLTAVASVFLPVWAQLSVLLGRTPRAVAMNRMGRATVALPNGPVIWVHAASLGELTAIRPVLAYLNEQFRAHRLLVTVNNERALPVLAEWREVGAIGQVAPMDLPRVVRRFCDTWRPVAFINVEAELWPNRFAALADAGTPAIFLNARLSDKSLTLVKRVGKDALSLDHFGHFFAQSAATTANLQALGIPHARIETTRNLKAMVDLPKPPDHLAAFFEPGQTLLAASTHPPEEADILRAYGKLRAARPETRLILSLRHPRRLQEVAELVRRVGLKPVPLSDLKQAPAPNEVVVVDTLGVQPSLYGLASVSFVGGSLPPDIGGHTPYEPIRAGSAVLAGPHTANFAAEYRTLEDASAYVLAENSDALANTMEQAFDQAADLSRRAAEALPDPGDPQDLFARIAEKLGLRE